MIYLFRWYLAVVILGWLVTPIGFRFFRRLPERGYAFAKTGGLLAVSYVFWLLGSLGFVNNDLGGLLLALALVGGLGFAWLRQSGVAEWRAWLQAQRRYILAIELTFLLTLTGGTLLRTYTPEILGTEKPMEFMFLNAIQRSPTFPPQDAWLSNHAISYYYFGYLMVAALARLTATPPAVAFNLGLGLLFTLTAVGAVGVVINLIALVRRDPKPLKSSIKPDLLRSFWPALWGPLLVLFLGNLYAPLELLHNNGYLAEVKIPMVWYEFGISEETDPADLNLRRGLSVGTINFWEWLDLKGLRAPPPQPERFRWDLNNWFFAARVIHDRNLIGAETEAIDEMPSFSFLLGDLHPHVLALPFGLLAAALALEWLLWGWERGAAQLEPQSSGPRLVVSGVILGALAFLNTWDLPIYWFVLIAALVLGSSLGGGWAYLQAHGRRLGALGLAMLALGMLLYLPFYVTFQSQAGGILPNLIYPTRFQQTLVMFGPPLTGVLLFLGGVFLRWRDHFAVRAAWLGGAGLIVLLVLVLGLLSWTIHPLDHGASFDLVWQRRFVDSLATLVPAAICGVIVGMVWGWLRPSRPQADLETDGANTYQRLENLSPGDMAVSFGLLLVLTGSLLLLGPEYVYLRDNFGTRMNTLFKFYFQVWVLWGLAAAFGIWYVHETSSPIYRRLVALIIAPVVLLGLVYPIFGWVTKTNRFSSPPTLDGMAYFARQYPDDWAAIQWLSENAPEKTIILEGTRGAYWQDGRAGRISMATGLPTVMGWVNHELQWRGSYFTEVAGREEDIQTVYQSRDWEITRALLDKYEVDFVIVSDVERGWYGQVYTPKFERHLRRVFQSGNVTIYQR